MNTKRSLIFLINKQINIVYKIGRVLIVTPKSIENSKAKVSKVYMENGKYDNSRKYCDKNLYSLTYYNITYKICKFNSET